MRSAKTEPDSPRGHPQRFSSSLPSGVEIHQRYDMFKTGTKIYVKPSTLNPGEALVIDRATEDIKLDYLTKIPTPSRRFPILGLMGIVKMINCKYLIVIEEKSRVGPEPGAMPYFLSNTWRIDKVNMVPIAPGRIRLTRRLAKQNDDYLHAMLEVLNSKTFYFSYDIDLSHTLQRIADLDENKETQPGIFARAKKMFIWNYPILEPFLKIDSAASYVVPVVNGFVSTTILMASKVRLYLSVISRRRRSRSGKRYFSRGINRKGYCSNFVETELIIEVRKSKVSFVMTRGSYPFYWTQWPDTTWQSKPRVMYNETSDDAFELHVKELVSMYGKMYLFDLANQHSSPKASREFSRFLATCVEKSEFSDRINFQTIDLFSLNWREEELHDIEVYGALREMLMTVVTRMGMKQRQKGVFHICSIDGTDLTDVLQFSFAKLALVSAVLYFELSAISQEMASHKDELIRHLTSELGDLWLAHSDALALYYVGTKSVGSEFYKTTHLSRKANWKDLVLNIERWYVNHFWDGIYQDCIEVCTKNLDLEATVADTGKDSILCRVETELKWLIWSTALPSIVVFCVLNILLPGLPNNDLRCNCFWVALLLVASTVWYKTMVLFFDNPKTTKKPDPDRTAMDWYFD